MPDLQIPELDPPKRRRRPRVWPLDLMWLAGLGSLVVGCGAYGWHIGAIVGGVVLLGAAAIGGRRL